MRPYKMITIVVRMVIGFLVLFGVIEQAKAVIKVEPDDFSSGTVINNAYPDVTLTALGEGLVNSNVLSLTSPLTTTGERVFGHTGDFETVWGNGSFDWLRVDFHKGATEVWLDFIADDVDSNAYLKAWDTGGTLIAQDRTLRAYNPGEFATLYVKAGNIAYITAEGDPINRVDNWAVDNLRYVPEPGTVLMVGLGGLALLRKRRK